MDYYNIEHLIQEARWNRLTRRSLLQKNFKYDNDPGIYILTQSEIDLSNSQVDIQEIIYVGISNSQNGVRGRLRQFLNSIENKIESGEIKQFSRESMRESEYSNHSMPQHFYYCVFCLSCNVERGKREYNDLLTMGDIARLHYLFLAHIKKTLGREPILNLT